MEFPNLVFFVSIFGSGISQFRNHRFHRLTQDYLSGLGLAMRIRFESVSISCNLVVRGFIFPISQYRKRNVIARLAERVEAI